MPLTSFDYPDIVRGYLASEEFNSVPDERKPLAFESFRKTFVNENEIKEDEDLKYVNDKSAEIFTSYRHNVNIPRFTPTPEQAADLYGQININANDPVEKRVKSIEDWRDNAVPSSAKKAPSIAKDFEFHIEDLANNLIKSELAKDSYKPGGMPDFLTDSVKRFTEQAIRGLGVDLFADYKEANRFFAKNLVENPEFDNNLSSQVVGGLGNFLSQMALSAGMTAAGAPELVAPTLLTMSTARHMTEAYNRELKRTGNELVAQDAAVNAIPAGIIDGGAESILGGAFGKVKGFAGAFNAATTEAAKRAVIKEYLPSVVKGFTLGSLNEGLLGGVGTDVAGNLGDYYATGDEQYLKNATNIGELARSFAVEGTVGAMVGTGIAGLTKGSNQANVSATIAQLTDAGKTVSIADTKAKELKIFDAIKAGNYDKAIEIANSNVTAKAPDKIIKGDTKPSLDPSGTPIKDKAEATLKERLGEVLPEQSKIRIANKPYTDELNKIEKDLDPVKDKDKLERLKKARGLFEKINDDGTSAGPIAFQEETEFESNDTNFILKGEDKQLQTKKPFDVTLNDDTKLKNDNVIYVKQEGMALVKNANLIKALGAPVTLQVTPNRRFVKFKGLAKRYEASVNPQVGWVPVVVTGNKIKILAQVREANEVATKEPAEAIDPAEVKPKTSLVDDSEVIDNKDKAEFENLLEKKINNTITPTELTRYNELEKTQAPVVETETIDQTRIDEATEKLNKNTPEGKKVVAPKVKKPSSRKKKKAETPVEETVETPVETPAVEPVEEDTVEPTVEPEPVLPTIETIDQINETENPSAAIESIDKALAYHNKILNDDNATEQQKIRSKDWIGKLEADKARIQPNVQISIEDRIALHNKVINDKSGEYTESQKSASRIKLAELTAKKENPEQQPAQEVDRGTLMQIVSLSKKGDFTGDRLNNLISRGFLSEANFPQLAEIYGVPSYDGDLYKFAQSIQTAIKKGKEKAPKQTVEQAIEETIAPVQDTAPVEESEPDILDILQQEIEQFREESQATLAKQRENTPENIARRKEQTDRINELAKDVGLKDLKIVNTHEELNREDVTSIVEAFVQKGNVTIILDNIIPHKGESHVEAVERIFKHEVVGHLKLSGVLSGISQEGFNNLVTFLKTLKWRDGSNVWERTSAAYAKENLTENEIVDEIFAKLTEGKDKESKSIIEKIVNWIRIKFLKAGTANWTVNDLDIIIQTAFDSDITTNGEIQYSKSHQSVYMDSVIRGYGAWIAPNGKIIDVGYQDHLGKAIDIIGEEAIEGMTVTQVYAEMAKRGYLRVINGSSILVDEQYKLNSSQKAVLEFAGMNSDKNVIMGDKYLYKTPAATRFSRSTNQFDFRLADQLKDPENVMGLVVAKDGTLPSQNLAAKIKKSGATEFEVDTLTQLVNDLSKNGRVNMSELAEVIDTVPTVVINKLDFSGGALSRTVGVVQHELETIGFAPDAPMFTGETAVFKTFGGVKLEELPENAKKLANEYIELYSTGSFLAAKNSSATGKYGVDPYSNEQLKGEEIEPGHKLIWSGDLSLNVPLPSEESSSLNKIDNSLYDNKYIVKESFPIEEKEGKLEEFQNKYPEPRYFVTTSESSIYDENRTITVFVRDTGATVTPKPKFESQHYEGSVKANQLAFVRGGIHEYQTGNKLPDGTTATKPTRILEIWEVQSDWAGKLSRDKNRLDGYKKSDLVIELLDDSITISKKGSSNSLHLTKREAEDTGVDIYKYKENEVISKEDNILLIDKWESLGEDISSPLLNYWESLALKAAVNFAQEQGADKIITSDAETAMMTEGHDQVGDIYELANPEKDGDIIENASYNNGNIKMPDDWIPRTDIDTTYTMADGSEGAIPGIKSEGPDGNIYRLTTYDGETVRADLLKKSVPKIEQESGMKAAYDERVPNGLKKLTNSQPKKVTVGRHGKGKSAVFNKDTNTGYMFSVPQNRGLLRFSKSQPNNNVKDQKYLAAVKSGDLDTAQKMVDEAAKEAGYKPSMVIHSTNSDFNIFGRIRNILTSTGRSFLVSPIKTDGVGLIYVTENKKYSQLFGDKSLSLYHNISNPADFRQLGSGSVSNQEFDTFVQSLGVKAKPSNGMQSPVFERLNKGQLKKELLEAGFDGFLLREKSAEQEADAIAGFDSSQFKSSDPVTKDDQGNVIPLSQRFSNSPDIRFSKSQPKQKAPVEPTEDNDLDWIVTDNEIITQSKSKASKEIAKLIKRTYEQKLMGKEIQINNAFKGVPYAFLNDNDVEAFLADYQDFVNTRNKQENPATERIPVDTLEQRLIDYKKKANKNEYEFYASRVEGFPEFAFFNEDAGAARKHFQDLIQEKNDDLASVVINDSDIATMDAVVDLQFQAIEAIDDISDIINRGVVDLDSSLVETGNPILDNGIPILREQVAIMRKLFNEYALSLITTDATSLSGGDLRRVYYSLLSLVTDGYPNRLEGFISSETTDIIRNMEATFSDPYGTRKKNSDISKLESNSSQIERLATDGYSYDLLTRLQAPFREGLVLAKRYHEEVITPYIESLQSDVYNGVLDADMANKIGMFGILRQRKLVESPEEGFKASVQWVLDSNKNTIGVYDRDFDAQGKRHQEYLEDNFLSGINYTIENGQLTSDFTPEDVAKFYQNANIFIGDKGIQYADGIVKMYDALKPLSKFTTEFIYGRPFEEIENYIPTMSVIIKGEGDTDFDIAKAQMLTDAQSFSSGQIFYGTNTTGLGSTKSRTRKIGTNRSLVFNINYAGESLGRIAVYDYFTAHARQEMSQLLNHKNKNGKLFAKFLGDPEQKRGRTDAFRSAMNGTWQNVMSQASYMHSYHVATNWVGRKWAQGVLSGLHQLPAQLVSNTTPYFVQHINEPHKIGNYFKAATYLLKHRMGMLEPHQARLVDKVIFEVTHRQQFQEIDKSVNLDINPSSLVEMMKKEMPYLYRAVVGVDKGIENILFKAFRLSDTLSGAPMALAEYLNAEQDSKGTHVRLEDLTYDPVSYIKAIDATERYIGIGDASRRGEYLTNKDAKISIARNLLIAFRSFSINNAVNFGKEMRRLFDSDVSREQKAKSFKYMMGIAAQSVTYTMMAYAVQYGMAAAIVHALKNPEEEEELKKLYSKSQNRMTKNERRTLNAEISMREKNRKVIQNIQNRTNNTRILSIKTVKDAASNMFIPFNLEAVPNIIIHVGSDGPEAETFKAWKKGEIDRIQKLIKRHKALENRKTVTLLSEELANIQMQEFLPAVYEQRTIANIGGSFGGTVEGIVDAIESGSKFFQKPEAISPLDFVNLAAVIGVSQPDIKRYFRASSLIEKSGKEREEQLAAYEEETSP